MGFSPGSEASLYNKTSRRFENRRDVCVWMLAPILRWGQAISLHRFFQRRPLCTADGLDLLHTLLDRRFCEKRPLLELFQNARPFVLLLESTNGTVDRFILSNDNSDQSNHLLRAAVSGRLYLFRDTLNNFGFSRLRQVLNESAFARFLKRDGDRLSTVRCFLFGSHFSDIVPVGVVNRLSDFEDLISRIRSACVPLDLCLLALLGLGKG